MGRELVLVGDVATHATASAAPNLKQQVRSGNGNEHLQFNVQRVRAFVDEVVKDIPNVKRHAAREECTYEVARVERGLRDVDPEKIEPFLLHALQYLGEHSSNYGDPEAVIAAKAAMQTVLRSVENRDGMSQREIVYEDLAMQACLEALERIIDGKERHGQRV